MATTKHELIERVRLIVQEVQADNAETIVKAAEVLNMMKQIENDKETVVLPQPCNGPLYADWLFPDYIKKMREELAEIEQAYNDIATAPSGTTQGDNAMLVNSLFLECTDMITVVTSAMDAAKCDEHMRQEYQRRVNDSNAVRDGGRRVKQKYGKELK